MPLQGMFRLYLGYRHCSLKNTSFNGIDINAINNTPLKKDMNQIQKFGSHMLKHHPRVLGCGFFYLCLAWLTIFKTLVHRITPPPNCRKKLLEVKGNPMIGRKGGQKVGRHTKNTPKKTGKRIKTWVKGLWWGCHWINSNNKPKIAYEFFGLVVAWYQSPPTPRLHLPSISFQWPFAHPLQLPRLPPSLPSPG